MKLKEMMMNFIHHQFLMMELLQEVAKLFFIMFHKHFFCFSFYIFFSELNLRMFYKQISNLPLFFLHYRFSFTMYLTKELLVSLINSINKLFIYTNRDTILTIVYNRLSPYLHLLIGKNMFAYSM